MSTATPANMLITSLFAISLPLYTAYHSYKFDGMRCLVPSRKNGVRTGMVWLIMLCDFCFLVWGVTFAWLKLPEPWGFVPTPITLWPKSEDSFVKACNVCIVVAFVLYATESQEETLYWIFLLRSMKKSRSTRTQRLARWLNSRVFWIWLALSIVSATAHITIPFAPGSNNNEAARRIFLFEGASATMNVVLSIILGYYLPGFIKQVADHGGSSDVLSKLTFFQEMNKLRLVLRFFFAAGLITIGVDVSTKEFRVTRNRFANDFVFITLVMTFWLSNVISLMLYLPVSWHKADGATNGMMIRRRATGADLGPHARRRSFQVGSGGGGKEDHKAHDDLDGDASQLMTQHSMEHRTLVTLLRERGTILDHERVPEDALFYDNPVRDDRGASSTTATTPKETRVGRYDHNDDEETGYGFGSPSSAYPTETSTVPYGFSSPAPPSTSAKRQSSYSEKIFGSKLPSAISRFAGPFAGVPVEPTTPQEVVIQVSKEVEVTHDRHHEPARGPGSYPPGRI
ncbi:hypothetical protein FFLO_01867 [Filobasidium floriforme]|uniref:Uncharacterized protein n=1 Tax=Filobasidium floriforme TaxID=5210 RepID=A0A8K0JPY3_9TREE|nr:hypothetical protein FFLO_01867 [Filobasidium floriforme]